MKKPTLPRPFPVDMMDIEAGLSGFLRVAGHKDTIAMKTKRPTGKKKQPDPPPRCMTHDEIAQKDGIPTVAQIMAIPMPTISIAFLKNALERKVDEIEKIRQENHGKESFDEIMCRDDIDDIKFSIYILSKEAVKFNRRCAKDKRTAPWPEFRPRSIVEKR